MTTVTCYLMFRWYYGPEFSGKALDAWTFEPRAQIEFTRPGKPTDNEHIESFNGKFRDECLNQNELLTLHDARRSVEIWRQDLQQAETTQLIGLADLGRISRKKYNMNPLENY